MHRISNIWAVPKYLVPSMASLVYVLAYILAEPALLKVLLYNNILRLNCWVTDLLDFFWVPRWWLFSHCMHMKLLLV